MDRESGGGAKATRRFSFSWADEVEREEAAQQQEDDEENQPPPRRGGETEVQTKENPFGTARPREVVLGEKGVDRRARNRDRELDEASSRSSAIRSRSHVHGSKRHGWDAPVTARRHEDSTPASRRMISAPPVSYGSAWGGKRKCTGQDEPSRQVRPVADHCQRVFSQLNIGEGGEFSRRSSSRVAAQSVPTESKQATLQLWIID
uniref:Eukaryotic translation initiation factor 4B1 n=1 Tax=Oryza coarctata TaxID=77588 RepID=A0A6C0MB89_ORYCO|nr:eukaryotic translation initiation factor 4B1 [Oryza coarctata]